MTFTPDHEYQLALLLGGIFLLVLLILVFAGNDRSELDPVGPRKRLAPWVLVAGAAIVALGVGGVLVLFLIPLIAIARRWGSKVVAAIAGAAFVVAGGIIALRAVTFPYPLDLGGFGIAAQVLSVLALCALLSSLVAVDSPTDTEPSATAMGESPG